LHIIAQQLLPVVLRRTWHLGIAVTGQIDQKGADFVHPHFILAMLADMGAAYREEIDMLGAPWRLGSKGQLLLVAQQVDGGRFARVGASRERDFRYCQLGQIAQVVNGGVKTGLPEKGHGYAENTAKKAKMLGSYCTIPGYGLWRGISLREQGRLQRKILISSL